MCINTQEKNVDFLNPIALRASVRLAPKDPPRMAAGDALPDLDQYPVVSQQTASKHLSVDWVKNCGHDHLCQSRMVLHLQPNVTRNADGEFEIHMDDSSVLHVNVVVDNRAGEDAHEPSMTFVLPPNVNFADAEVCNSVM